MGESCLVQQLRYEHKTMAGGQPQAELRARDNCVCYTFWQRTPRRDAKEATSLHLHPTILCVRYDFCNKKKVPPSWPVSHSRPSDRPGEWFGSCKYQKICEKKTLKFQINQPPVSHPLLAFFLKIKPLPSAKLICILISSLM